MNNFDVAFNRVLGLEGGYSNNPEDPGGETNWGISKRSYPNLDIKNLTREAAKAIYLKDFWLRIHADEMPWSIAFQAFDFAANSGIGTAVRKLQTAAGVADDGWWGPVTLAAVAAMPTAVFNFRFLAERLDFMRRLKNWPNAGRGWAGRIAIDMRHAADDLLKERPMA